MKSRDAEAIFIKGLKSLNKGNTVSALSCFERAILIEPNPTNNSYFAFCIAKERGQFKKAISLCEEAIGKEPENPVIYLNLGRIYLLSGKKEEAIKTFREGLRHEENQDIVSELNMLGTRKPLLIPFLKRGNPLNKYLGVILRKLGHR